MTLLAVRVFFDVIRMPEKCVIEGVMSVPPRVLMPFSTTGFTLRNFCFLAKVIHCFFASTRKNFGCKMTLRSSSLPILFLKHHVQTRRKKCCRKCNGDERSH